jgi:hypothetical protein
MDAQRDPPWSHGTPQSVFRPNFLPGKDLMTSPVSDKKKGMRNQLRTLFRLVRYGWMTVDMLERTVFLTKREASAKVMAYRTLSLLIERRYVKELPTATLGRAYGITGRGIAFLKDNVPADILPPHMVATSKSSATGAHFRHRLLSNHFLTIYAQHRYFASEADILNWWHHPEPPIYLQPVLNRIYHRDKVPDGLALETLADGSDRLHVIEAIASKPNHHDLFRLLKAIDLHTKHGIVIDLVGEKGTEWVKYVSKFVKEYLSDRSNTMGPGYVTLWDIGLTRGYGAATSFTGVRLKDIELPPARLLARFNSRVLNNGNVRIGDAVTGWTVVVRPPQESFGNQGYQSCHWTAYDYNGEQVDIGEKHALMTQDSEQLMNDAIREAKRYLLALDSNY